MTNQEILNSLIEIVTDIKGKVEITEKTALVGEQILDSLELINYLTQIEEKFGLEISFDTLADQQLGIVSNMIKYLSENQ